MGVQGRIQDFSQGGAPTPKSAIIFQFFAENCMKMKEFGPPGGGARPWRPPLDPPMEYIININDLVLKLAYVLQLGNRFSFSNNQNKK